MPPSRPSRSTSHRRFAKSRRVCFNIQTNTIRKTATYDTWYAKLRDQNAKARIDVRIRRLELGNFGTVEPVGEGVSELKIDYGPGYRVYFVQKGKTVFILLCGGDKSSQTKDVKAARKMANDVR
jgi:putative addiction module killer protein